MEAFTHENLAWGSHVAKIDIIKGDVNKLGEIFSKLNQESPTASYWQRTAIDRMTPMVQELANNTSSIINLLTKEKGRYLNTQSHKDYLKANADVSVDLASMIADFVDYGQTKARLEMLARKLELSD
jgi:hypothetical protein